MYQRLANVQLRAMLSNFSLSFKTRVVAAAVAVDRIIQLDNKYRSQIFNTINGIQK